MSGEHVSHRLLIYPEPGTSEKAFNDLLRSKGLYSRREMLGSGFTIVDFASNVDETELIHDLSSNKLIKCVEFDEILQPQYTPNDPNLGSAWYIDSINCKSAWDIATGTGQIIAILDSGADSDHPDLAAQYDFTYAFNLNDNNTNVEALTSHGIRVSGVAAAAGDNGVGSAGIAYGAKIMPIRITLNSGSAYTSSMTQGLNRAAQYGATVASLSFTVHNQTSFKTAATNALLLGCHVSTAIGNDNQNLASPVFDNMFQVSSLESDNNKSSYSNYGPCVNISAPGSGMYTTDLGGGYASPSGTSYSAPTVAGVVALVKSANPGLSPSQVFDVIFNSVTDLGTAGRDPYFGYGKVNAFAAVTLAQNTTPDPDTIPPIVVITSPVGGATVSGIFSIGLDVFDNIGGVGVAKVELYIDHQFFAEDLIAPYGFTVDTSDWDDTYYNVKVVAIDLNGNKSNASINIYTNNGNTDDTTGPVIIVDVPFEEFDTINGTFNYNIWFIDQSMYQFEVYLNGIFIVGDVGSAHDELDTTFLPNGDYMFEIKAWDEIGNVSNRIFSFTVFNPPFLGVRLDLTTNAGATVSDSNLISIGVVSIDQVDLAASIGYVKALVIGGKIQFPLQNFELGNEVLVSLFKLGASHNLDERMTARATVIEVS